MSDRDELAALRRLAELEAKAGGAAPTPQREPASALVRGARGFARPFIGSVQGAANVIGGGAEESYNRAASDWVRQDKENAAGQMDIAGGIGQALNPINALATRLGPTGAGAVFGATNPVETEGGSDYFKQAAQNAAIDAAGGKAINVVGRRLLSPLMDRGKQALVNAGVNLTPGQRGGAIARTVEAVAEKIPVVGNLVKNRRVEAIEGFNRKKGQDVLDHIGAQLPDDVPAGQHMVGYVTDMVGQEYDRVLRAGRVVLDGPMRQAEAVIRQAINGLPPTERQRAAHLVNNYLSPLFTNGRMTGEQTQQVVGQLRALSSRFNNSNNPMDADIGRILNQTRMAVIGAFERNSPPAIANAYRAVRTAYSELVPIQTAAGKAVEREGVFDPKQLLSSITKDASRRQRASGAARGQQEAQEALDILGTMPKQPDNLGLGVNLGTAGTGALLGLGNGPAAATLGTLGAAYTRPGSALVNALLNRRPEGADQLAQYLQNYGGSSTAALADALRRQQQGE